MTTGEVVVPANIFGQRRNPIFTRELLTLLRSKKAFVLLLLYLALSMTIILASWPRESTTLLLQGAVAREIFAIFALGQTLLLALLLPATLGPCMTVEKEGETIDLLLTTPVSARQIVVGKLLSGLFYFLLLQIASVPVLLLCFVIGGLSWQDVFGLYLYLFTQLLVYGLTSVNCSVFFHRTHVAVILSYVFVGIEAVIMGLIFGNSLGLITEGGWLGLLILTAMVAIPLFWSAVVGARRPFTPVRKSMEEEDASKMVGLIIRRDRFPDRLIVPKRRVGPLEDGVNPVLDKELQAEIYGSGSLFIRLVIQLGMVCSLAAFLWVLSYSIRRTDEKSLHPEYPYFCFLIAYVVILAPSIATSTFTHEKEEHTIESLVLTLIPRRQIVTGKFLAIARVVGALTALNAFLFLLINLVSSFHFSQLLALAMVTITAVCFVTALGMVWSLYCRSTLSAMITTYFMLFALYVGPILAETFLTRLFPGISLKSIGFLSFVSPFLACRLGDDGESGQFSVLIVHMAAYGLISLGMILWMTRRFESVLRKQSQIL